MDLFGKLNQFLQPNDAPVTQNRNFVGGLDFNTRYDRDAVTAMNLKNLSVTTAKIGSAAVGNAQLGTAVIGTAQIGTLSFNQITGGTATLGGTTNGNGLLNVKDASGSNIVTLDNSGIMVNNGSITIKNSGGTSIIDSSGLISTANFINGAYSATGVANFTGTSPTDVTGGSLTFVLSRTSNVLTAISANVDFFPTPGGGGYGGIVYLTIDGTIQRRLQTILFEPSADSSGWECAQVASHTDIVTLAAGTHTLKMQASTANNGQQFSLYDRSLIYIILGS